MSKKLLWVFCEATRYLEISTALIRSPIGPMASIPPRIVKVHDGQNQQDATETQVGSAMQLNCERLGKYHIASKKRLALPPGLLGTSDTTVIP